jgi:excisionase family DNA binding protein
MTLVVMDFEESAGDDEVLEMGSRRLFLSPQEAADLIGSSRGYVYSLLGKGHLKSLKLEGRRMIPTSELERLTQMAKFDHDGQHG